MALPARLARYQSLLDLLVEAALCEMESEQGPNPSPDAERDRASGASRNGDDPPNVDQPARPAG